MFLYHVDRDYSMTLEAQKKQLAIRFPGFKYLFTMYGKITFTAE